MAPISSSKDGPHPYQRHLDAYRRAADRAKRIKLQHDSSPEPSTVSDDSALIPTSVPEDTTDASDVDSTLSSEVSESSDEPSDDSSDEDGEMDDAEDEGQDEENIVNLRANRGKKPDMKLDGEEAEDIRPFLKDFLPKLKAANEELEAQREAGTLETAEMGEEEDKGDGEEQYIELNLGLGVLEANGADASDLSTSKGDDDEDGPEEEDVLGKLMGREKAGAGVQVVEEQEDANALIMRNI